ncbi:MAG TPA: MFS transporter [Vicinamibacterales bacterium]|nr:MFS transporter [Vicinamibacterales bacterium]
MYQLDVAALRGFLAARARRGSNPVVARTVWLLGFVSLFTDISSEMVSSILPLYLFVHLQLSPVQFGLIDGLYQGVTAVARLASGIAADRWRQHKLVAAGGYGLSAICKLGLLAAGSACVVFAAIISADRVGKGIRSAPRDAMISLATRRQHLATAFGVHRAMDTVGVVVGPLLAYAILAFVPGRFDAIFVLSFAIALIGIGVLVLLVDDRRETESAPAERIPIDIRALVRHRDFRAITIAAALASFVVVSDAFLYLLLQSRRGGGPETIPLLYVGSACAYLVLAAPVGRWADRVGRTPVFLMGQVCMIAVYAGVAWLGLNLWTLGLCLLLHGAYYAATDGVLVAMVSGVTRTEVRASSLAALTTATSLARLCGSVVAGVIWSWRGPRAVVMLALAGTVVSLIWSATTLRKTDARVVETGQS